MRSEAPKFPKEYKDTNELGEDAQEFVADVLASFEWAEAVEIVEKNSAEDNDGIDIIVTVVEEAAKLLGTEEFCVQVKPNPGQAYRFFHHQEREIIARFTAGSLQPDHVHPWEAKRLVLVIHRNDLPDVNRLIHDIFWQLQQHILYQHYSAPKVERGMLGSKINTFFPLFERIVNPGQATQKAMEHIFASLVSWDKNPNAYIDDLRKKQLAWEAKKTGENTPTNNGRFQYGAPRQKYPGKKEKGAPSNRGRGKQKPPLSNGRRTN